MVKQVSTRRNKVVYENIPWCDVQITHTHSPPVPGTKQVIDVSLNLASCHHCEVVLTPANSLHQHSVIFRQEFYIFPSLPNQWWSDVHSS